MEEVSTWADVPTSSLGKARHRLTHHVVQEPLRDWSLGFVTGHRTRVVFCLSVIVALLYWIQEVIWYKSEIPDETLEMVWSWMSLLWVAAIIPGTLGLLGMLAYRYPRHLDEVQPTKKIVSWRIVSRGTNIEALASTIKRCKTEMDKTPLFDYIVEVIVEEGAQLGRLPQDSKTVYLVVPDAYETPNKSQYKARALQYALENSLVQDDTWLVHLDEETQPTSSGIKGICRMIQEEEQSGKLRAGQGAILYHRDWKKHPVMTLADNVRTGDDFARFYFQHRLGITIFGLHGSYIVVRNDVEKAVGFDFGPQGSITEDAFWALVLMENGGRARWCEGYLEEQSTQGFGDFTKQRRRWYQGLVKVSVFAPVKFRWRFCLGLNTLLWTFAPFAGIYTLVHFIYGFEVRPLIRFGANFSYAAFLVLYMTGLKANMDEHGITNRADRALWTVAQIILTPLFSLLEGVGVLMAIVRPVAGFHVIKK